eukprot:8194276-Ditylum_brightwellii.AAC.1
MEIFAGLGQALLKRSISAPEVVCATQLGLCQLVYEPPINTDDKESDSNVDNHDGSAEKKMSSSRILRNNPPSSRYKESSKMMA